jgi:hypothetical protein
LTVRLRWKQAGLDQSGAFVLHETPLFLLVSANGSLDRLHQDPEARPGFVAQDSGQGAIKLQGRGGLGFLLDGKVRDDCEIAYGSNVIASFEEQQWTLAAEGKAVVKDPLVGTDLGGYRVLERLGNGSMGVVYRALQINLEREIALKILDPKAAKKSPLAVASFKREAVAAGRLSHPNLVQVYDVGFERGLHFFAMELVPGGDLELLLDENGPLPWREAFVHILDCAEALCFAQEHHLVHRDVKPENLMLTVDGRTKLADLGMAATRGMVEVQGAGGTPHFMAPECVSGEHIDFRSDLYSLGCTLFRLLTGKTPFDGESVRDILRGHRDSPIPSLKDYGVDAPSGVQDLVEWLMAKNPDARPASPQELITEMQALLETKRSNGLLIGVLAVAVIAVGVSLFTIFKPGEDPVYVEVESPDAQQDRDRAALLEAELAFTQAMAVAEGEEREFALRDFLSEYPSSDFHIRALDEIERLGSLPLEVAPQLSAEELAAAAQDAATKQVLAQLGSEVSSLLQQQKFGQAEVVLATSPLSPVLLVALWSEVETVSDIAYTQWNQAYSDALREESWLAAQELRNLIAASAEGSVRNAERHTEQLASMDRMMAELQEVALQRDFDTTRTTVVVALREQVLTAVESLDFTAAKLALEQAAAGCDHAELAAALLARASLFADAQAVMDAVYTRLDGTAQLDIVEPIDGKRAFATKADAGGVQLLVTVRGERVARTDPWSAFMTPESLPDFLTQVLEQDAAMHQQQLSLQLLLAEATLARRLSGWGAQVPSESSASETAAVVQGWLKTLDWGSSPISAEVQIELQALQQLLDLSESLADADGYEALLHARGLGMEFSLLSAWSSSGEASWGLTP